MIPESYTFMGMLDNSDQVNFYQREQFWIKKLNTLTPHGLNIRSELPPPIHFSIIFNDHSHDISNIVKTIFRKIQERAFYLYRKTQLVTSYRRNPNLKDLLVKARLY